MNTCVLFEKYFKFITKSNYPEGGPVFGNAWDEFLPQASAAHGYQVKEHKLGETWDSYGMMISENHLRNLFIEENVLL